MRLRIFVLIGICIILDVLVVRQVRQYDDQKILTTFDTSKQEKTAIASTQDEIESGQEPITQEGKASATAC